MTKKRNNLLIAYIILLSFAPVSAQPFSKYDKEVLELIDIRNARQIDFDFNNINQANDKKLFSKYSLAIMNINDTALADSLIKHYKTSRIDNKASIIRLLGYLNCSKSREFLSERLKNEEEKNLLPILGLSLGRIGSIDNLKEIINSQDYFVGKVLSLYQFGSRKITNDKVFEYIKKINGYSLEAEVDDEISYIFYRTGTRENLSGYKPEIMLHTASTKPFTRMWAFSALGKLQDTSTVDYMLEILEKEDNWRVRVNICIALGNQQIDLNSSLADKIADVLLKHSKDDASAHVSITALTAIAKLFGEIDVNTELAVKIQQGLRSILTSNKSADWQIAAEVIKTYSKIFKDGIKDEILSLFSQTDNYDIKASIIGSFSFMNDPLVYKELRDSISLDVQRYNVLHPNKDGSMIGSDELAKIYKAFVECLSELDDKLDVENRNNIRLIFSEFSASKNPAIVDICLTNLQDSVYLKYRDETCRVMMFDYDGFAAPKDRDVMILFIQAWDNMKFQGAVDLLIKNLKHNDYDIAKSSADALKNITGKDYEKEISAKKYRTDFDWDFIDKLSYKRVATIKTDKGDIKVELFPETAPFTVQNFVKLGEQGFYNNTIFHRVVPNFVIQGGDRTGTGYGGPGYSIRSEFSPITFGAYFVGMASSGKDTEGSQFFITHSPQPHLDARYTLFGKVIEGFDVVDKIQIGNKIEAITFGTN